MALSNGDFARQQRVVDRAEPPQSDDSIGYALGMQDKLIHELFNSLNELDARLDPVLRPSPPEASQANARETASVSFVSTFGTTVRQNNELLIALHSRLQSTRSRIDL